MLVDLPDEDKLSRIIKYAIDEHQAGDPQTFDGLWTLEKHIANAVLAALSAATAKPSLVGGEMIERVAYDLARAAKDGFKKMYEDLLVKYQAQHEECYNLCEAIEQLKEALTKATAKPEVGDDKS